MGKFDPPKPKPPVRWQIVIRIRSMPEDEPLRNATAELVGINWGVSGIDGEVKFFNNTNIRNTKLIVTCPGYGRYEGQYDIPSANLVFPVGLTREVEQEPEIKKAPKVSISGRFFTLNGNIGRIQEIDNFNGFAKFIDNSKQQKEYLKVWRDLGFNACRVFINLSWGRPISALTESNYYIHLENYFDFCYNQGFIVECGILQDCIQLNINKEQGQEIVRKVTDIGSRFGHIIFHNNEPGKNLPANSSPNDFSGFVNSNVIYSHGSRIDENDVIKPVQDYIDEHSRRDAQLVNGEEKGEWWRRGKDIKDISDIYGVPCHMNEPLGADNVYKDGSRSNIPREFLVYSGFASLFGSSCFHSTKTAFSEIPDSIELECARAYAEAFKLIDPEWMTGEYSALHLGGPIVQNESTIARAYFKIKGNNAIGALAVGIPGWPNQYKIGNGWQLDEQFNDVIMTFKR